VVLEVEFINLVGLVSRVFDQILHCFLNLSPPLTDESNVLVSIGSYVYTREHVILEGFCVQNSTVIFLDASS